MSQDRAVLIRKVDPCGAVWFKGVQYDIRDIAEVGESVVIEATQGKVFHCSQSGKLTEIAPLERRAYLAGAYSGAANDQP